MDKGPKAKVLALEGAVLTFVVVAVIGVLAGAESHIAALRALGAGVAVGFLGRFPALVFLEALELPAGSAAAPQGEEQAANAQGTVGPPSGAEGQADSAAASASARADGRAA